ncbi:alpha/beta fold hydrolase [Weissella sagaensis]|uniref:alpha/beta fold hydrolase n=1 Tax=Weissella sagaensis TaxID=2559928 RepID=UPI0013ECDEB0|nr:alpha/beta hydrolase [Weissella sagaensis]
MKFRTSDGISLAYTDTGGEGQPIIFLAGYSGVKEEWYAQKVFFEKVGYRVITLDHRNHGSSSQTIKGLRIARLGQDLANLIDYLHLENIVLVGHSMGASVIWAYLSLWGNRLVSHIITVDQSPKALNTDYWPFGALDLDWQNLPFKVQGVTEIQMTKKPVNAMIRQQIEKTNQLHPFNFERNLPLVVDHLSQNWCDVLMNIDKPQLFLTGEQSPMWSSAHGARCVSLTKQNEGMTYEFKGVGHMPHIESPGELNDVVFDFIR